MPVRTELSATNSAIRFWVESGVSPDVEPGVPPGGTGVWTCRALQNIPDAAASVDEWAEEINKRIDLRTSRMVAFGRLIYLSRLSLKYGAWEQLFRRNWENRLPFGKTTGKKWFQIGEVCWQDGQDPDHLKKLPCAFEAMYQVSRLGIERLRQFIDDGTIHPGLSAAQAKELAERFKEGEDAPEPPFELTRILAHIREQTKAIMGRARLKGLELSLTNFEEMSEMLKGEIKTRQNTEDPETALLPQANATSDMDN